MNGSAPFLDVRSFVAEEALSPAFEAFLPPSSPFLSLYETEMGGMVDPEADEYLLFLHELYDEEFDVALSNLVDEAAAIYEAQFPYEQEDPQSVGYQAERLLNQHFAPLVSESEALFTTLARELGQRDPASLSQGEIDTLVDRYQPSVELAPSFEEFWGKIKKIAKKAVNIAKKGISAAAKLGLGPILNKLKALIKPLLARVIQTAIGKLPPNLQPIAKKLAEKLPLLKEFEESDEAYFESTGSHEISAIQNEFNQHVADLLFAHSEVEQDLEVAKVLTQQAAPDVYPLAELDRARDRFVENLRKLREGEDPTPQLEEFIPAILPALRIGIQVAGRARVVSFLAGFLAKLIQRFVGPQYAPALSQAIVDAGLRLLTLETTSEDESTAAASAVAATVEETVRRVAALPEYVFDNQELLEGFALEAFEQAAAANLPPVLPQDVYQKRPELGEATKRRGVWLMMPSGRRKRKRYKRFSRRFKTRLFPRKVAALETMEGAPVEEMLEDQLGIAPGEEVEAFVHLYEAIPGTTLSHIARHEEHIAKVDGAQAFDQLHPLTREAASLLLGEPELGRDTEAYAASDPNAPPVGQRFYYLEIPGKRPLTVPGPAGRSKVRRVSRARLVLDFPKNEARVYVGLSEIRAQEFAVKLRQHAHNGVVIARLRRIVDRGMGKAFAGSPRRLKIIHEAAAPGQGPEALKRLPSVVSQVLRGRLIEWTVKGLADHLKQHGDEFKKAAEDTADGVTLIITLENPPGFPQLRDALKAKTVSIASLKLPDGAPTVKLQIVPGSKYD